MKRSVFFLLVILALALALMVEVNTHHLNLGLPLNLKQVQSFAASINQVPTSQASIVTGKPTITAQFINQVLAAAHSPAGGTGAALYQLGVKYGIDPVYALAFFKQESTYGTQGMARTTLSLGNLRCSAAYACFKGYAAFSSWQAGYEAWYQLIRGLYVNTWHLSTIEQIVPTYAPSSDHNNPIGYIQAVEQSVKTWRVQK